MSLSWPSWFTYGNTILAFPRAIIPNQPDFMVCDSRYGEKLVTKHCKLAVAAMPAAREGAEVEWAVNHQTAQYTLPMTLNGDRKGEGWSRIVCQLVYDVVLIRSYNQDHCAVSIEAAGPLAHYDVATYNPPFTLKASPFQLRGLAAHVVNSCVKVSLDHRGRPREGTGGRGGFATHQIQNLADYVMVSDDLSNYRMLI